MPKLPKSGYISFIQLNAFNVYVHILWHTCILLTIIIEAVMLRAVRILNDTL